jgi:hypothetical protein
MRYNDASTDVGVEFTHKSFCDYLAARYLARKARQMLFQVNASEINLDEWISILKDGLVTPAIADFVAGEIKRWPAEILSIGTNRCGAIIELIARIDVSEHASHKIMSSGQWRALGTTFLFLSALIEPLGANVPVKWPHGRAASEAIEFLAGWRSLEGWSWRHEYTSLVPNDPPLFPKLLSFLSFSGQNFVGARWWGTDMFRCLFDNCDMRGAQFTDSIFSGASFKSANLQGTSWNGCNLQASDLRGADIRGADLRLANGLSRHQLHDAIVDHTTLLPF